jgi:hypothetical protein
MCSAYIPEKYLHRAADMSGVAGHGIDSLATHSGF